MKRVLRVLVLVGAAALLWFLLARKNKPPEVSFTHVTRDRIVNTLTTNGKVEPVEWATARAEVAGVVAQVLVQRGQRVEKGAAIVTTEARQAQSDLESANARIAQARSELQVMQAGGRAADVSAIESSAASARQELAAAQRDLDSLQRLQARGAATPFEVTAARDRVDRAQLQVQAAESRRRTLVTPPDRSAAEARLREAEAAAILARQRISASTVRAPVAGTVYQLGPENGTGLRPGAYLNPGDPVASIGKLDRVRVIVYVDEPDLGRVAVGMPVTITWDAMPGRTWAGTVEKTPTQVVALGTRQVGEVQCIIDNPDRDLLPGTNINAEIRSRIVENALTIPKESIRREQGRTGVYVLGEGDKISWRDVQLGTASVTRSEVTSGLKEGDRIALTSDRPLSRGMEVTPIYP